MATHKNGPKKTADLPPKGDRNRDPITEAPGAHPIETGLGAALGGAASGVAVGAVAGPVGAALGAAVGAVAGGYAGKGIGELIDPTTEDNWLRETFASRPYAEKGQAYETYEPAYRYGGAAESQYQGRPFEEVEPVIRSGWESHPGNGGMGWEQARGAIKDGYERTVHLRSERRRSCKGM
jgi:hypothetical protein